MCRSLYKDYRPLLPVRLQVHLVHRYRRTQLKTLRQLQQEHDVEVPSVRHQDYSHEIQQKPKPKIKVRTSIQYWETCCMICQVTPAGTSPRDQIRNLQEKWYRASSAFSLTSLRTEIAKYARGPQFQGLRAEDVLAEPYLVQKILVS